MAKKKINFDPNLDLCGKFTNKTVRLVFGRWLYRKTIEVVIGGNCSGLSVIDSAVESVFDDLECIGDSVEGDDIYEFVMDDSKTDHLRFDFVDVDELKNLLISAEIIGIEPDGK